MKVAIIDYGVGNLGSLARCLEELKVIPILAVCPEDLRKVDRIILPGVGNFSECIKILKDDGWDKAILDEVNKSEKPIIGICLGMQLLASYGFEGSSNRDGSGTKGLGLIPGSVINLKNMGCNLRIPHVGWNEVKFTNKFDSMFNGIPENTDFYFVHSYGFVPKNIHHVIANTKYGVSIVASVRNRHVWGTQFHPEKSSRAGVKLLENFLNNPIC